MEIDHTTSNLPHVLYHVGILIIVVTSICGLLHLFFILGLRNIKSKNKKIKEVGGNRYECRQKKSLNRKKKKPGNLQSELRINQRRK